MIIKTRTMKIKTIHPQDPFTNFNEWFNYMFKERTKQLGFDKVKNQKKVVSWDKNKYIKK